MSITIKTGLMALALLGSTALTAVTAQAADKEISWIYCGDTIDPVHTKYIKQWEEKNAGWKVTPEVVGWAQCQDKATTLAAAGTPVAMAYVGSRTLKEFAQNDLIVPVPMTDDEKKSYYPNIVDTVTFEGNQWGVPIAFSTKALYWNKDLFKQAGPRSREAAEDLGRRNRDGQNHQGKDRHSGLRSLGPRPSTTPCTSSCIGFTPTTAR